jgi:hypothetical protein
VDEFLSQAFSKSIHGDFICPDILEIVKDVDFRTAGELVDGLPNSIYHIVHHLTAWGSWGLKGASGFPFIRSESEEELNFFPADESPTETQWISAKVGLNDFIKSFESSLSSVDHTANHQDWKSFNNGRAMLFVVAHTAYHTAHIVAILRLLKVYHRP